MHRRDKTIAPYGVRVETGALRVYVPRSNGRCDVFDPKHDAVKIRRAVVAAAKRLGHGVEWVEHTKALLRVTLQPYGGRKDVGEKTASEGDQK